MTATLKEAALRYARNGISVLPCRGKVPLLAGQHGFKNATDDVEIVERLWSEHPNANIGIFPGSAGLLVIDVDVKGEVDGHDALAVLEAEHGTLPDTRCAVTPSGGEHRYFRVPQDETFGNSKPGAGGIDIRCSKGYVVAPPSILDGNQYRWTNELRAARLPDAWVELLREKPYVPPSDADYSIVNSALRQGRSPGRGYVVAALEKERELLLHAPEGDRHHQLTRFAFSLGQLTHEGLLEGDIAATAEWVFPQWTWSKTRPNFNDARRTLRECLEAGKAKPRGAK